MKVVVVGGGLAGLTAAHRVRERAPEHEVIVLEAGARAGGLLATAERDGFVIETGPESILRDKPAAIELASRLGLADRVIETRAEHRGAYIVSHGRLEKVPAGFSLMAPGRWDAWLSSPIVSWPGKLRAMAEPLVPRRRGGAEESLAAFVERRLGREVLDRLAQPLIGGIYGGDPERLSLAATMPRFVEMERRYGSVVRGVRASQQQASGARYGLFFAFDRGMQVLVDALLARLDEVRLGAPALAIERANGRWAVITEADRVEADRVILAAGAAQAARLLGPHHRRLGNALGAIPHGSATIVTFAWPRASIPHPMEAFGFVVPAIEGRPSVAATFSSVKWPGRAPEGEVLLRVFLAEHVEGDDAELEAIARGELRALIGVQGVPRFSLVSRFERAMPRYELGHLERADAIEAMEAEVPGVVLVGNALRGVGIPDTIRYAEAKVDRALAER